MKNWEKYEKEIKKLGSVYNLAVTKKGKVVYCSHLNCGECKFYNPDKRLAECGSKRVDWLYEECKSPLLTKEEKNYLKTVIGPFKKEIEEIGFDEHYIWFNCGTDGLCTLPIGTNYKKWFNNVESPKAYTLKELGLEEKE